MNIVLFGLVWAICVSLLVAVFLLMRRVQRLEDQMAGSIDMHRRTADLFESFLAVVKK